MAVYTQINLPYHNYRDGNPVFVETRSGFSDDFGKTTPAKDRDRQEYFHWALDLISKHLVSKTLPVFIQWSSGEQTRMDKGCIGHALAAKKIRSVIKDEAGMVTHVEVQS